MGPDPTAAEETYALKGPNLGRESCKARFYLHIVCAEKKKRYSVRFWKSCTLKSFFPYHNMKACESSSCAVDRLGIEEYDNG